MIKQVKEAVIAINPKYGVILKKLHLHYDMKLVSFFIDDDLIHFPVFLKHYSQSSLTYQIVPTPRIDQNTQSYSHKNFKFQNHTLLSMRRHISLSDVKKYIVVNILVMIFILKGFCSKT